MLSRVPPVSGPGGTAVRAPATTCSLSDAHPIGGGLTLGAHGPRVRRRGWFPLSSLLVVGPRFGRGDAGEGVDGFDLVGEFEQRALGTVRCSEVDRPRHANRGRPERH